ncbi:MAG: hypothetical protein VR64_13325 [Desulfatitalea sp. BRH_c12]|nr:MAG: hypothetical protein VR64_13325 [Desulfatitalea sp. BRH_c12]
MVNKDFYSAEELAREISCSRSWIYKMAPEIRGAGHAQLVGKVMVFFPSAIQYIKDRPDNRGRPPKTKANSKHQF